MADKKLMTWADVCEVYKNTPLIMSPYGYDDAPYLREYLSEYDEYMFTLDVDCREKYGSLRLIRETEDASVYNTLIRACCIKNHYKWKTLWETMFFDYDPIANVDGTETTTTVYGQHVTSNDIGQRSETTNNGARVSNGTEAGNTFPYNDPNVKKQTAENTFSNTTAATTDSKTIKPATDTTTSNEHTDVVTHERKGNIGITSTQSLIGQQREIALFDFYAGVLADIVDACTIPVFMNEEVCCFGSEIL